MKGRRMQRRLCVLGAEGLGPSDKDNYGAHGAKGGTWGGMVRGMKRRWRHGGGKENAQPNRGYECSVVRSTALQVPAARMRTLRAARQAARQDELAGARARAVDTRAASSQALAYLAACPLPRPPSARVSEAAARHAAAALGARARHQRSASPRAHAP